MNRLHNLRLYLCGAIESQKDFGKGWRQELTPFLESKGCVVLDPTNKKIDLLKEDLVSGGIRHQLKIEGKFRELREYMKPIRHFDLRCVDVADALIVYLDLDVRAFGTYEEIAWANIENKPVLVVVKQTKIELNDWAFAQLIPELFFDTFDELKTYLNHVDTADSVEDYGRWRFLNL
jgi:nucleoside 2-deoxyribosyltransferase